MTVSPLTVKRASMRTSLPSTSARTRRRWSPASSERGNCTGGPCCWPTYSPSTTSRALVTPWRSTSSTNSAGVVAPSSVDNATTEGPPRRGRRRRRSMTSLRRGPRARRARAHTSGSDDSIDRTLEVDWGARPPCRVVSADRDGGRRARQRREIGDDEQDEALGVCGGGSGVGPDCCRWEPPRQVVLPRTSSWG